MSPNNPSEIFSYQDALDFVNSLGLSRMALGLSRMEKIMTSLSNPQDKLSIIHVGGTNGKGSVVIMLEAILTAAGHTVGSFTSPHLIDIRERIHFKQKPISEADFTQQVSQLKAHLDHLNLPEEEQPTYFEFLNILAFQYFSEKNVDFALLEVGLGGRLDSTNVIKAPMVSVITHIGWDHMDRLGDTLGKIAAEKAGIIKESCPLVMGPHLPEEAKEVILAEAKKKKAPVWEAEEKRFNFLEAHLKENDKTISKELGSSQAHQVREEDQPQQHLFDTLALRSLRLPLMGPYQLNNLTTVMKILEVLGEQGNKISYTIIHKGLKTLEWPARFQVLPEQQLIIDGSHNKEGFNTVKEGLIHYFANHNNRGEKETLDMQNTMPGFHWLVSLRANRPLEDLIGLISAFPNTRSVTFTTGPKDFLYHCPKEMTQILADRGFNRAEIYPVNSNQAAKSLSDRLSESPKDWGIVTGSLYTAGEVLKKIQAQPFCPGEK